MVPTKLNHRLFSKKHHLTFKNHRQKLWLRSSIWFDVSTKLEASGGLLTPARYSFFSESAIPRARLVTRRTPSGGNSGTPQTSRSFIYTDPVA